MADESVEFQRTSNPCVPEAIQHRHFRIGLRGQVDKKWAASFDPIVWSILEKVTIIEVMADQAGLRGILNRLWDLNLDIFLVCEIRSVVLKRGE